MIYMRKHSPLLLEQHKPLNLTRFSYLNENSRDWLIFSRCARVCPYWYGQILLDLETKH
ncbi:hypothetical protein CIPAW_04G109300 [Carya illinoinensis]|uniref:Uncharacterized protein n=1 Tax=Carya illinoinensis TaxID=32201 RepID=A0A8T1QS32_CARIL|nr:hypothetical protein CIPAW_04G109300 [Carya illinoinensis]